MRAVLRLVALAAVPAALGLGLVALALPRATAGQRLAARVLGRLEATPLHGAVLRLDGAPLQVSCRPRGRAALLSLGGGTMLVVRGAHVVVAGSTPAVRRQLAAVHMDRAPSPEVASALADLAGPRRLYAQELIDRLVAGEPMIAGVTTFDGVRAYRVRLGGDRPVVVLYASVATLRPLGVSFDSRRISGTSRLLAAAHRGC